MCYFEDEAYVTGARLNIFLEVLCLIDHEVGPGGDIMLSQLATQVDGRASQGVGLVPVHTDFYKAQLNGISSN